MLWGATCNWMILCFVYITSCFCFSFYYKVRNFQHKGVWLEAACVQLFHFAVKGKLTFLPLQHTHNFLNVLHRTSPLLPSTPNRLSECFKRCLFTETITGSTPDCIWCYQASLFLVTKEESANDVYPHQLVFV